MDSNLIITVIAKGVEAAKAKMEGLGATITKLKVNANGMVPGTNKLTSALNNQAKATDKVAKGYREAASKQKGYFKHIARTTIQSAFINKLFLEMVDVMGQAIEQVDALNNFPATMAAMGQSAEDTGKALQSTRDYIGQIGGNLGDATKMVTRFTGATNNVKSAAAIFQGINNALIAGSANDIERRNVITQFSQGLERGFPDAKEWKTMTEVLSRELTEVANAMGIVNGFELGRQLRAGEVSMGEFVKTLTQLSTGQGSIAKLAETQMKGLEFAWYKLKNTVVQGMSAIIDSVGRANLVNIFTAVTQTVKVLISWLLTAINFIITLFNLISGLFGGPQLGKLGKDLGDGIADAAGGAGDLADGLDDAGGSAKKLNKSLAAFDKMNVLPDQDSGSGGGGSGGGAGFSGGDPASFDGIEDFLSDVNSKMEEISGWAKVLAGLIAGFAGIKFASGILNQFKSIQEAMDRFNNSFKESSGKLPKVAEDSGKNSGTGWKYGLASGLGSLLGWLRTVLLVPALGALAFVLAVIGAVLIETLIAVGAVAAGITVPFWGLVAIGAVIVAAVVALIWVIWKNWDKIWGFIKKAADEAWKFIQKAWDGITEFFVGLWHGVYAVFTAVWEWLKEWGLTLLALIALPFTFMLAIAITAVQGIAGLFGWLWNTITGLWSAAYTWFKENVWDKIVSIFSGVATWFSEQFTKAWEGIKAIWSIVWTWFKENVWDKIVEVFSVVGGWFKEKFLLAWDNIKEIFTPVFTWFKVNVWDKITGIFSGTGGWFKEKFQTAFNNIKGIFSGLWTWFKTNVWDKIVSLFSNVGTSIGNAIGSGFKSVINTAMTAVFTLINGFINAFNWAVRAINKLPGVTIKEIGLLVAPQLLARGGIVDQPTLAMIGENGSEAVVPLENNTEWLDKLAAKINTTGNGQPIQLTVQIGEETIASQLIELINEKSSMSGRNVINV